MCRFLSIQLLSLGLGREHKSRHETSPSLGGVCLQCFDLFACFFERRHSHVEHKAPSPFVCGFPSLSLLGCGVILVSFHLNDLFVFEKQIEFLASGPRLWVVVTPLSFVVVVPRPAPLLAGFYLSKKLKQNIRAESSLSLSLPLRVAAFPFSLLGGCVLSLHSSVVASA